MHHKDSETSYDSSNLDLSINESFIKSDIANIISKMYTAEDNAASIQTIYNVEPRNKSDLSDESSTKPVDVICGPKRTTVSNISPVVDSSTSDSVSMPRGRNELRSFRVVCECCRRKIMSRVVQKRVKTTCNGCTTCLKYECFLTKQSSDKYYPGAQISHNEQGLGDCNFNKGCSMNYLNHVKEMHEDCKICQSNLGHLRIHEQSTYTLENIPDAKENNQPSKAGEVENSLKPTEHVGVTQEQINTTKNSSKNIKTQSMSLSSIFKMCMSKKSSSSEKCLDEDVIVESNRVKSKTKAFLKRNDGKSDTNQESHIHSEEADGNPPTKTTTSIEIFENEIQEKRKIEWNQFWFDFFKPARQVFAAFNGFILTLLEFFLDSMVRPLLWGTVQIVCKYFFQPCLDTVFHSILHPIFVLLTNIVSSIRDLFFPVAECFGYFLKECSTSCRTCRTIEEPKTTVTPNEVISGN